MRAFSGHLPPEELLILWDLVSKQYYFFNLTKLLNNNFFLDFGI